MKQSVFILFGARCSTHVGHAMCTQSQVWWRLIHPDYIENFSLKQKWFKEKFIKGAYHITIDPNIITIKQMKTKQREKGTHRRRKLCSWASCKNKFTCRNKCEPWILENSCHPDQSIVNIICFLCLYQDSRSQDYHRCLGVHLFLQVEPHNDVSYPFTNIALLLKLAQRPWWS